MARKGQVQLQFLPHEWKDGSTFKGKANADKVQQEIDMLAGLDPNGKCSPTAMVDFAQRHPQSELYKCFEWDDTKAAHAYRLNQATEIKISIVTPVNRTPVQPQQIKIITNHALKTTPGIGHKNIEIIVNSATDMKALDQDMYDSIRVYIRSFEKRFALAPSYAKIEPLLKNVEAQLP